MRCAECPTRACGTRPIEKMPAFCPMRWEDDPAGIARHELQDPLKLGLALNAARVEGAGYGRWTRVEETMEFAKRCGFRKLGLAFCSGLREEGRILNDIFKENGFEVVSAICSCGGIPKESMGLTDAEKVTPGRDETLCNPIGQAHILHKAGAELNVVVGLCVGHDSLFLMHSKEPCTVLITKDRVLAHNAVGALYLNKGYYRNKLRSHHLDE
ncbi:MAG: DUF1847 domain-containing protein [Bacillota bacterium]|nr:DUF1847 domain-containing protein [Bacillota bacterium]